MLRPLGQWPRPPAREPGSDQPMLADVYRLFLESFHIQLNAMKWRFGQQEKKLGELVEGMREKKQRIARPEQDARQPRLAM